MVGLSNSGIYTIGNKNLIYLNGKRLPPIPDQPKSKNHIRKQVIIGNHVFVNGYEYKNGEWKKTLRALWYSLF